MKIVTLNPPFLKNYSRQSRSPCVAKSGTIYYPYYLAYATGALENAGYDVNLIDAVIEEWSHEDSIGTIKKINPNLIILDTSTPSIINDVKFADKLKRSLPDSHITLVGTHPTNLPEETLRMSDKIDSVCRGEYDFIVVELADALKNGNSLEEVNGLSLINTDGEFVSNKPAQKPTSEQLDELSFVSEIYLRHLGKKKMKKYFYASITSPYIQILTARGCPYSCSFCPIPSIKSYRTRSIENVVEEFIFIQKEMPFINEVLLEDDTFPINKKRTIGLCDAMIEASIQITWSCNARVNTNEEVMRKMKEAGCRLLCVGFESPTQDALDGVEKKTNVQMQKDFMQKTGNAGLLVNGCFIMGLPGDTPEIMQATIEFAKELLPNTAQFYPLMLYPGTASFNWADKNGYILTKDWSKWLTEDGLHNTVLNLPGLPPTELLKWANKGRLEFYTNPKFLYKMFIQAIIKPREAIRMYLSGRSFFKHLFKYIFSKSDNCVKISRSAITEN